MGYTDKNKIKFALENGIRLTVYSLDYAKEVSKVATEMNKKAYIHIKIDTGMSRIGFLVNENSIEDIKKIFDLENVIIEGM